MRIEGLSRPIPGASRTELVGYCVPQTNDGRNPSRADFAAAQGYFEHHLDLCGVTNEVW